MVNLTLKTLRQNAISELTGNSISKFDAVAEVEILIEHVFGLTKKDYIMNPNQELSDEKLEAFNKLLNIRVSEKIPVQYLTGKAHFMGEEFLVNKNVLIPRPETELLVLKVIRIAKKLGKRELKILDIGTGSGCIACMLAKNLKNAKITACDISKEALKIALNNAKALKIESNIEFLQSDVFFNIKNNFDIIVSNPPYIPIFHKESLQQEVVEHEPHSALFAEDEEGIYFYKKIILESHNFLNTGGYLAFELGINQSESVKKLFLNNNFQELNIIKDFSDIDRVIFAKIKSY